MYFYCTHTLTLVRSFFQPMLLLEDSFCKGNCGVIKKTLRKKISLKIESIVDYNNVIKSGTSYLKNSS